MRNDALAGRTRQASNGFSLVELLVVIGVIALLIAMLMPALAVMRAKGKQLQCQANLRSMGVAAQIHMNDHQGYLPAAGHHLNPVGGVVNPKGLEDPNEKRYIYYSHQPFSAYIDVSGEIKTSPLPGDSEKRPVPVTVALAICMGVNVRLDSRANLDADMQRAEVRKQFSCPSQEEMPQGVSQMGGTSLGWWRAPFEWSSYVFNEALLGRRNPKAGREPSVGPVGKAITVKQPSTVMLAMDGRPRGPSGLILVFDVGNYDTVFDFQQFVSDPDEQLLHSTGMETLDFTRHRYQVNVLFVDGHVESLSMSKDGLKSIGVSKGIYE